MEEITMIRRIDRPEYHLRFDTVTGTSLRWGETLKDDPKWSMAGPEHLDIEISTGACLGACGYCYKSNGNAYHSLHMSFSMFKQILDIMPKTLMQIAFGITDNGANKYMYDMFRYCRDKDVVPNYTSHGLDVTKQDAHLTAKLCGVVGVSVTPDLQNDKLNDKLHKGRLETKYDAVARLKDSGMQHINLHYVVSNETVPYIPNLIESVRHDPRLQGIDAILFLAYKPKGRNEGYSPIQNISIIRDIITECFSQNVKIGMDSCSAPMFLKSIEDHTNKKLIMSMVEPCEAGLFNAYIDVVGALHPCSMIPGTNKEIWNTGIPLHTYIAQGKIRTHADFIANVWRHERLHEWRRLLIHSSDTESCKSECAFHGVCRSCPIFDITPCKNRLDTSK